jgi:hypothetical protein
VLLLLLLLLLVVFPAHSEVQLPYHATATQQSWVQHTLFGRCAMQLLQLPA